MKLFASQASSFARKIRVMLIEKGIPHHVQMIDLSGANDLKKINPIGKVPALQLDDGRVLVNSPMIADYIERRFPEPHLVPVDPGLNIEVRCCEALADGAMDAVAASLHETRFHDETRRSQTWLDRQRGKAEAGLAALERMLGDRSWLVSDTMSLADITAACHLRYMIMRAPQFCPEHKYPNLVRLWTRMEARDSMKSTAPAPPIDSTQTPART